MLPDLHCRVLPSRVTGLLGPSGCGKTTVMRTVVGVQRIVRGHVTVLGRPAGSAELRGRVGYAPQNTSVYGDLTVRQNLRYFAELVGATVDVDRILEQVRLDDNADQLVQELSGGQQSRANLAVALLGRPKILVLDEPTVGLDPVLRRELWRLFHDLAAAGLALLVSSHVMDEADRCDELLLMRAGRLLAHDTPDGLRHRTGRHDLEEAFLHLIQSREECRS